MGENGVFERTTLALVAHCDDFELGMGGTAGKLVERGWIFHIFVLSSQRQRARNSLEEAKSQAEIREEEARRGAESLGISRENVHFLRVEGIEDRQSIVGRIHNILESAFGERKPNFPFVFSHTRHDRHLDHATCEEIAGAAFRVPILKFAVASSTDESFQPDICIDTTDWFERKVQSFSQHKSQAGLRAGALPIVEALREFDGRNRQETGFAFSECFELGHLAFYEASALQPILDLCDSDRYRQALIAKLTQGGSSYQPRLNLRVSLGPNASCSALLRSGRLPFSFGYTAIDGCAEVFATPADENRYAGFREDQVRCAVTDEAWSPDRSTTNPPRTKKALREALDLWRRQTSYPRALRTLLAAPAEPVTDRRGVELLFGCSDYFTVRSLTEIARGDSFDEGIAQLFPARDWWADTHARFGIDVPPYHVSAQGVILNRDPETGTFGLVLTVYNSRSNPMAGGIGVSMAEQMAAHSPGSAAPWWETDDISPPVIEEGDAHIFRTLERGLLEEFSLRREDYDSPRLLSACLEAEMFFVTFLFVVRSNFRPVELFERWRRAPDRQESQVLALFPIGRGRGEIPPVSAVSSIAMLLECSGIDLGPFLLPLARAPGIIGLQPWHPSSRMRLYAVAKHWWGDAIDGQVSLETLGDGGQP